MKGKMKYLIFEYWYTKTSEALILKFGTHHDLENLKLVIIK